MVGISAAQVTGAGKQFAAWQFALDAFIALVVFFFTHSLLWSIVAAVVILFGIGMAHAFRVRSTPAIIVFSIVFLGIAALVFIPNVSFKFFTVIIEDLGHLLPLANVMREFGIGVSSSWIAIRVFGVAFLIVLALVFVYFIWKPISERMGL